MVDDRKQIGSAGAAGRGNKAVSPSQAARSLAGGATPRKAPVKAKPATPAAEKPAAKKTAKAAAAKPAAPKKTAAKKAAPAKKAAAKKTAERPHLRAVTDDDAARAAAAAAAADEARTRTAGSAPLSAGIPIDELAQALIQGVQRVAGSDWEAKLATLLHTVRKRLGGDYEVDEFGFDPEISQVLIAAVEPLAEKWFRLEVRGIENIPTDGGALLVANHSGTVPIDGIITGYAVNKHTGRTLRPLGADLVFSLPVVGQLARKVGATLACTVDAERLLTRRMALAGTSVAVPGLLVN